MTEQQSEALTDDELFGPGDVDRAAPEDWERVWFQRIAPQRDRARVIRAYVQHGAAPRYPAFPADLGELAYHDAEPPRWAIVGLTEPLTGPQLLSAVVQLALVRAADYRTASGRQPKDAVIRVVVEDVSGAPLARLKKRYLLPGDGGDDEQEDEPEPPAPGYDDAPTAMLPAGPLVDRLFATLDKLIGAASSRGGPLLGADGAASPQLVELLIKQAAATARAEGYAEGLRRSGGRYDDDDDDDDAEEALSPARRALIDQLPAVTSEIAGVGKHVGSRIVDHAARAFGLPVEPE